MSLSEDNGGDIYFREGPARHTGKVAKKVQKATEKIRLLEEGKSITLQEKKEELRVNELELWDAYSRERKDEEAALKIKKEPHLNELEEGMRLLNVARRQLQIFDDNHSASRKIKDEHYASALQQLQTQTAAIIERYAEEFAVSIARVEQKLAEALDRDKHAAGRATESVRTSIERSEPGNGYAAEAAVDSQSEHNGAEGTRDAGAIEHTRGSTCSSSKDAKDAQRIGSHETNASDPASPSSSNTKRKAVMAAVVSSGSHQLLDGVDVPQPAKKIK